MSEPSIVPYVKTTPKPFGVDVEWKWPGGCLWLELQYLHEDGRLVKEIIHWPAINYLISGLKAGERLQLRLRPLPVGQDGSARDWRAGDWIEGVSSVDTEEIIEALDEEIRNSCALHGLKGGWFVDKTGKAYIHEALIGDGVVSANYIVKMNVNHGGKLHVAGMTLGVEEGKQQVTFKADRFKVHEAASSIIGNAVVSARKMKIKLGDEMTQAIIDAVRESDLFAALQAKIDAQTASVAGLQLAVRDVVNDVLRNALKPGGLLYKR
ncbi:phage tail tip fiber protein [Enterobacter cloacae complex sp. SYL001]|uniref:phage tail tip fiber protein n=1 Tax=Enterobacter cloacae complex sp. SYL001 TaxID=3412404 RepID=UPI003B9F7136